MRLSRNVDIMADSAYEILTKDSKEFTGNFCIDDIVLHEAGVKDFTKYASVPFGELMPDFFVPEDTPLPDEILFCFFISFFFFFLASCFDWVLK
jgi:citronellol/citronellal dehydrogenase